MRVAMPLLAILITTTSAIPQQPATPSVNVNIVHADDAWLVGTTTMSGRNIVWAYDRTAETSQTLYAAPGAIKHQADLCDNDGVVFLVEKKPNTPIVEDVNYIVVDMRKGDGPVLKIIPAFRDDGAFALGTDESTNSLILGRRHSPGRIGWFLIRTFEYDVFTETLEHVDLDTLETTSFDLNDLAFVGSRTFVHEGILYCTLMEKPTSAINASRYDLANNKLDSIFMNFYLFNARLHDDTLEVITKDEDVFTIRDKDGKTLRQTIGVTESGNHDHHLYQDGVLSHLNDLKFIDTTSSTLIAQKVRDVFVNGDEIILTYHAESDIGIYRDGTTTRLQIPHTDIDYIQTIAFNNMKAKPADSALTLRVALGGIVLAAIAALIIRARRKTAKDD